MQKNNNTDKITHADIIDIGTSIVRDYARAPLPDRLTTYRRALFLPCHYRDADQGFDVEDDFEKAEVEFERLPCDELLMPRPVQYNCDQLGSVLAVALNSKAYFQTGDLARILDLTSEALHSFIDPRHFTSPKLCGAGDAVFDFVEWEAVSLFCISNFHGQFFIAWAEQIILTNLLEQPVDKIEGISAVLLHALIPNGLDFSAWKQAFLHSHPESGSAIQHANDEDFRIPLSIAKEFSLANYHYYGTLAYILIREAETLASCNAILEELPVFFRLRLNRDGHIDARGLHVFLASGVPFETWITGVVDDLCLVDGLDYFTPTAPEVPSKSNAFSEIIGVGLLLTAEAVARILRNSPSDRGRLFNEYFSEAVHRQSSRN